MAITGLQIHAARALAGWSRRELAAHADLSPENRRRVGTVKRQRRAGNLRLLGPRGRRARGRARYHHPRRRRHPRSAAHHPSL